MTDVGAPTLLGSVAIVGSGLIGTSIALTLRSVGIQTYLMDRDPDTARTAQTLSAGVAGPPSSSVDLAVVAVPPSSVATVLAKCQANGLARVYTDTTSVKALPSATAQAMGCDLTPSLVGIRLPAASDPVLRPRRQRSSTTTRGSSHTARGHRYDGAGCGT